MISILFVIIFSYQAYSYNCENHLKPKMLEMKIDNLYYDVFSTKINNDPMIRGLNSRFYGYEITVGLEIAKKLRRAMINDIHTIIRVPVEDYKYLGLTYAEALTLISKLSGAGISKVLTDTSGWVYTDRASNYLNY